MQFNLGANPNRPKITATVTSEDIAVIHADLTMAATLQSAQNDGLATVKLSSPGPYIQFHLDKIRTSSATTAREELAIVKSSLKALIPLQSPLDTHLSDVQMPWQGLRLGLSWPEADNFQVSEYATSTMQRVWRNLGNAAVSGDAGMYNQKFVMAKVERHGNHPRIELHTSYTGAGIATDRYDCDPYEPTVQLRERGNLNNAQQLMCLAGAIAIARADEILAT